MNSKQFFIQLLICCLVALGLVYGLSFGLEIGEYFDLSLLSLLFFAFLSIIIFYMGKNAAQSENQFLFMNIIVMNMVIKMLLSFGIILMYVQIKEPENKLFVIPFFIIYFIFNAFETHFMTKQSKVKSMNH